MDFKKNKEIQAALTRLKEEMLEYILGGEASLSEKNVENCLDTVNLYLKNIANTSSKKEGRKVIKETVLVLNEMNESCNYELIETGERENICEIFILTGYLMGYNEDDEDLSEQWRDW